MLTDPDKEPIRVNKILGKQASLGPIPANQVLPWFTIVIVSYFIFNGVLGWELPTVFALSFWLVISWWLLTGNDPDNYVNRFRKHRARNWTIGGALYISPLLSKHKRRKLKNSKLNKF